MSLYLGNQKVTPLIVVGEKKEDNLVKLVSGQKFALTANDLKDVTNIINYAFAYSGVSNVILPDDLVSIGSGAFEYCNGLTNISIPNSVNFIGSSAFRWTSIMSVIIPNNVTTIKSFTFANCAALASVTIPNSVTSIDSYAFLSCSNLTNIIIPNSVTSIGNDALVIGSVQNNATFVFLSVTPPTISYSTFRENTISKIIVPKGCADIYKSATNWAAFGDYIEEAAV